MKPIVDLEMADRQPALAGTPAIGDQEPEIDLEEADRHPALAGRLTTDHKQLAQAMKQRYPQLGKCHNLVELYKPTQKREPAGSSTGGQWVDENNAFQDPRSAWTSTGDQPKFDQVMKSFKRPKKITADDQELLDRYHAAGGEDYQWYDDMMAREGNTPSDIWYHVEPGGESKGFGTPGELGPGLYMGKDPVALYNFYLNDDVRGGATIDIFQGEMNILDLKAQSSYDSILAAAKEQFRGAPYPLAAYAKSQGYDGIAYFDPGATGTEYLIFDSDRIDKILTSQPSGDEYRRFAASKPTIKGWIQQLFNPDQPRDPTGTPTGGQWTDTDQDGEDNPIVGNAGWNYDYANVWRITNAKDITDGADDAPVAVAIKGTHKGEILKSENGIGHVTMITTAHPDESVDNWVRFMIMRDGKGRATMHGDISFAGVVVNDQESEAEAADNIYDAYERILHRGMREQDAPLDYYGLKKREMTSRWRRWVANLFNPNQPRHPAGSKQGGEWTDTGAGDSRMQAKSTKTISQFLPSENKEVEIQVSHVQKFEQLPDEGMITVGFRGDHKGEIIYTTNSEISHGMALRAIYPEDSIDDYARFTIRDGALVSDTFNAGTIIGAGTDWRERAINHIYIGMERLREAGLPAGTKVTIEHGIKNPSGEKKLESELSQGTRIDLQPHELFSPDQPRHPAGSPAGGEWSPAGSATGGTSTGTSQVNKYKVEGIEDDVYVYRVGGKGKLPAELVEKIEKLDEPVRLLYNSASDNWHIADVGISGASESHADFMMESLDGYKPAYLEQILARGFLSISDGTVALYDLREMAEEIAQDPLEEKRVSRQLERTRDEAVRNVFSYDQDGREITPQVDTVTMDDVMGFAQLEQDPQRRRELIAELYSPDQPRHSAGSKQGGEWKQAGLWDEPSSTSTVNRRLQNIADQMGIKGVRVFLGPDRKFTVDGKEMNMGAEYIQSIEGKNNAEIRVAESSMRFSDEHIKDMLAHELGHHEWHMFMSEVDKETEEISRLLRANHNDSEFWPIYADGRLRPEFRSQYPAYRVYEEFFSGDELERLMQNDGITRYSEYYWNEADTGMPGKTDYMRAINETIAEISRLNLSGKSDSVPRIWKTAYKIVHKAARRVAP